MYGILLFLLLIGSSSLANKLPPQSPSIEVEPELKQIKSSRENGDKGTLMLDPKQCRLVLIRDNLEISLITTKDKKNNDVENFHIKFGDGDTVIGNIDGAGANNPACFHSLTTNSVNYRVKPNFYNPSQEIDGLKNCALRPADKTRRFQVTTLLQYLPNSEYLKRCKETSDCFHQSPRITIEPNIGLSFYSDFSTKTGPSIKRSDLQITKELKQRCRGEVTILPGTAPSAHDAKPGEPVTK